MNKTQIEAVISRVVDELGRDKREEHPNAPLANLSFRDRDEIAKACVAAIFDAAAEMDRVISEMFKP